jgi:hypothetical protein
MHSNRRYLVCLQFFHCQFVHIDMSLPSSWVSGISVLIPVIMHYNASNKFC